MEEEEQIKVCLVHDLESSSHEHWRIGGEVSLADNPCHKLPELGKLKLPNGLKLSFGEIIALAGDFYGVPDKPIIDPKGEDDTDSSRRQRFISAYDSLARGNYQTTKEEVKKILKVVRKEGLVELGDVKLKANIDSTDCATSDEESSDDSLIEQWDESTGGIWFGDLPFKWGRVMKLAARNYDHFLPYAKDAYLVGHELAMEKAKEASRAEGYHEKRQLLQEAYCIDGFACHFLTDCFATGHARTPRYHLEKCVTVSKIGSLLSKFMHDEDNKYGLRVTNKRGDKWIAYGDGMLLTDKSSTHYKMTIEAVQISVDEVYEAFEYLESTKDWTGKAAELIPFIDESERNNFPMFRVLDYDVVRRQDLENLSDPTATRDWTGLFTLIKLWLKYKPRASAIG